MQCELPAVVTVIKTEYEPRRPSIKSKMAAKKKEVGVITLAEIENIDKTRIGLGGSPTKVKKTFTPELKDSGVRIKEATERDSAMKLLSLLSENDLL